MKTKKIKKSEILQCKFFENPREDGDQIRFTIKHPIWSQDGTQIPRKMEVLSVECFCPNIENISLSSIRSDTRESNFGGEVNIQKIIQESLAFSARAAQKLDEVHKPISEDKIVQEFRELSSRTLNNEISATTLSKIFQAILGELESKQK
jgi:hypothetical protein